jgi:hypothetical protein
MEHKVRRPKRVASSIKTGRKIFQITIFKMILFLLPFDSLSACWGRTKISPQFSNVRLCITSKLGKRQKILGLLQWLNPGVCGTHSPAVASVLGLPASRQWLLFAGGSLEPSLNSWEAAEPFWKVPLLPWALQLEKQRNWDW